jgi:hypothetical protein
MTEKKLDKQKFIHSDMDQHKHSYENISNTSKRFHNKFSI